MVGPVRPADPNASAQNTATDFRPPCRPSLLLRPPDPAFRVPTAADAARSPPPSPASAPGEGGCPGPARRPVGFGRGASRPGKGRHFSEDQQGQRNGDGRG